MIEASSESLATGAKFLASGQVEAALAHLVEAADLAPTMLTLALLAVAFAKAGAFPEALSTMQEAINKADHASADELLLLAYHTAEMGLEVEAVEFLVRFLALRDGFVLGERRAVDVLKERAGTYETVLAEHPRLSGAVAFLLAFEKAMLEPPAEPTGNSEGALAMFEATRPMRERASKIILPG